MVWLYTKIICIEEITISILENSICTRHQKYRSYSNFLYYVLRDLVFLVNLV